MLPAPMISSSRLRVGVSVLPLLEEEQETLLPGTCLGEYVILEKLGRGTGTMYLAEQPSQHRRVALKVLRRALSSDVTTLARFFMEARSLSQLAHPALVEVCALGYEPEVGYYIAVEYLEGESLRSYLHRRGALSPYQAVEIVCQALEGLTAAHTAGITHRDLKPADLFLVSQEGRIQVRLLHFGLSQVQEPSERALLETLAYQPPEQSLGPGEADARGDLYAVGVVLYEMITGRRPFAAESLEPLSGQRPLAPGLPSALEALVLECLAKHPEDRPQSAYELRERLRALQPYLSRSPLALSRRPSSYRPPAFSSAERPLPSALPSPRSQRKTGVVLHRADNNAPRPSKRREAITREQPLPRPARRERWLGRSVGLLLFVPMAFFLLHLLGR